MHSPNYKLGWYIPDQIMALTHFHPDVSVEDITGVIQTGELLLRSVKDEFHMIIDNRVVNMSSLISLNQMKEMVPYTNHPTLRWIIVIKPVSLELDTNQMPIEQAGKAQLKNVASLQEAIDHLQATTKEIEWDKADTDFFPNTKSN
jgi:hypothetical protein